MKLTCFCIGEEVPKEAPSTKEEEREIPMPNLDQTPIAESPLTVPIVISFPTYNPARCAQYSLRMNALIMCLKVSIS